LVSKKENLKTFSPKSGDSESVTLRLIVGRKGGRGGRKGEENGEREGKKFFIRQQAGRKNKGIRRKKRRRSKLKYQGIWEPVPAGHQKGIKAKVTGERKEKRRHRR